MDERNVILLIQSGSEKRYEFYRSVSECVRGIVLSYNRLLRTQFPSTTYFLVSDLIAFLEAFEDISCYVYQRETGTYVPYCQACLINKVKTSFEV